MRSKNGVRRFNDTEREMWVNNLTELYRWFRSDRRSITQFIREERVEIDRAITAHLDRPKGNTNA